MTPRQQRRAVLRQRSDLLARARRLNGGTGRRPATAVSVIAAATADAWLYGSNDAPLAEHLADDRLVDAAERAGVADFELGGTTQSQLDGAFITMRGARGEQWVADALEADLLPRPLQTDGVELTDFHTPGTDLRFGGETMVNANVKIGSARSTLTEHLNRHPDVDVVYGSTELAAHARDLGVRVVQHHDADFAVDGDPVVVNIGRSAADFDADIADAFITPDTTGASLPIVSTVVIAWRAVGRIRRSQPKEAVIEATARDVAVATAAHAAARLVRWTGAADPVTALAGFATATSITALSTVRRGWLNSSSDDALLRRLNGPTNTGY